MPDVQAYYERNRARYDAPERYRLWRILCKTREEAQEVLGAALADSTPKTFAQLASEALIRPIIQPIVADVVGVLGGNAIRREQALRE